MVLINLFIGLMCSAMVESVSQLNKYQFIEEKIASIIQKSHINPEIIEKYRLIFEFLDVTGCQVVGRAELKYGLLLARQPITAIEIDKLFKQIDSDNNQKIELHEFVMFMLRLHHDVYIAKKSSLKNTNSFKIASYEHHHHLNASLQKDSSETDDPQFPPRNSLDEIENITQVPANVDAQEKKSLATAIMTDAAPAFPNESRERRIKQTVLEVPTGHYDTLEQSNNQISEVDEKPEPVRVIKQVPSPLLNRKRGEQLEDTQKVIESDPAAEPFVTKVKLKPQPPKPVARPPHVRAARSPSPTDAQRTPIPAPSKALSVAVRGNIAHSTPLSFTNPYVSPPTKKSPHNNSPGKYANAFGSPQKYPPGTPQRPPASAECSFLYLKPHANTRLVDQLIRSVLKTKNISIAEEGEIAGPIIDRDLLFDKQYSELAEYALLADPIEIDISATTEKEFENLFYSNWHEVVIEGRVYNCVDAFNFLKCSNEDMSRAWSIAMKKKKTIKLGKGLYCGFIDGFKGFPSIYVINGFFKSMRNSYISPNSSIHYYCLEWESGPHNNYFGNEGFNILIGDRDPAYASPHSIRGLLNTNWRSLGMTIQPSLENNFLHASKSAFEALVDRGRWLSLPLAQDPLGIRLLSAQIPSTKIKWWATNPVMLDAKYSNIPKSSIPSPERNKRMSDHLYGMGTDKFIKEALKLAGPSSPSS